MDELKRDVALLSEQIAELNSALVQFASRSDLETSFVALRRRLLSFTIMLLLVVVAVNITQNITLSQCFVDVSPSATQKAVCRVEFGENYSVYLDERAAGAARLQQFDQMVVELRQQRLEITQLQRAVSHGG